MSPSPVLSVVVVATDSAGAVARCVASVGGGEQVEVIVAAAADRDKPGQGGWPCVRRVVAEDGTGVPRLRRLGLEQARAPLVAFTEDSCRLSPGWADAWLAAFRDPATLAATGPVEHEEGGSAVDWGVFFCEYAPFLRPMGRSQPVRLAGNNFAARRDWLMRRLDDEAEVHETLVASHVATDGGRIAATEAVVWHVRRYQLSVALRDRLRFGFTFGRLRAATEPPLLRLLAIPAGPAILLVQLVRLGLTLGRKRRHCQRFLATWPLTVALLAFWSVGEWLGWVLGAGSSSQGSGSRARFAFQTGVQAPFPTEHGCKVILQCASSSPPASRAATSMQATS